MSGRAMDKDDENSSDSDGGLQIVLESPRSTKRRKNIVLDAADKEIVAEVEKDFEDKLEQKAAKANLTATHVKNILKHVVTNEHVLALLRNDNSNQVSTYEPKCTRAKARQMPLNQTNVLPYWSKPVQLLPETQILFSQELSENSEDDDEYVPKKKELAKKETQETIALRTRSKLSLNDTPLEKLEESFIPPDITTDMYDIDCDDDVWADFLKTFSRPLEEVVKAAEDEEQDPEYNILADEEIDKVDKEELRVDRAVTVTRKELNELMNELSEYADIYELSQKKEEEVKVSETVEETNLPVENVQTLIVNDYNYALEPDEEDVAISKPQVLILIQQLRQHVQILAQNFLLSYDNPEFYEMAPKFQSCLTELNQANEEREISILKSVVNLQPALQLIETWRKFYDGNSTDAVETKFHVRKQLVEAKQAKSAGTEYIVTFPPLLMDFILKSPVFLYPNLLPRIPYRPAFVTTSSKCFITNSEEHLIAICLERLIQNGKSSKPKLVLNNVYRYIATNLMKHVSVKSLSKYIIRKKSNDMNENPIKYFFREEKAPPTVHYVGPLDDIRAPLDNDIAKLPYEWKTYVDNKNREKQPWFVPPIKRSAKFSKASIGKVAIPAFSRRKRCIKSSPNKSNVAAFNRIVEEALKDEVQIVDSSVVIPVIHLSDAMFRDMPSLGSKAKSNDEDDDDATLTFKNVISSGHQYYKPEQQVSIDDDSQRDNPEDINELMRASSTVKHVPKKEPSGAEKKRLKLRRDFLSNLGMASPANEEQEKIRQKQFASAYFDKLHQTLDESDLKNIIHTFNSYDPKTCDFVEFFDQVESILAPKYKQLADEFLLFTTQIQAYKIGKLMPYLRMQSMELFLRKVQIYFKEQPTHMKRIMKCLTFLSKESAVTMETVKMEMLPLLKGNATLIDLFLQLFDNEKPPELLANGPSEFIDLNKELSRPPENETFETVVVPDTEDPYGGSNCICTCHTDEDGKFKTRLMHCTKCSLKFINGKIFIQRGKLLRPAVVSFLTNPNKDHTKRLSATPQRKRLDTSPNKSSVTTKQGDLDEDVRNSNNESEEDVDGKSSKRVKKVQRVRKQKNVCKSLGKKSTTTKRVRKESKTEETKVEENRRGEKRPAEMEFNEPPEFIDMKHSSDHSGSESEYFESSQDVTNSDTDESSASSSTCSHLQSTWSRDEDKIILQAFKQGGANEETFKQLSTKLETRSVNSIKNRFYKLMSLLQEMTNKM